MPGIEAAAGDGNMDVRVLIELAPVGVQRTEDADLDAQFARVPEHGACRAAKQVVEQRPVVVEERPQLLQALDLQLWQRKREWVQSGELKQ